MFAMRQPHTRKSFIFPSICPCTNVVHYFSATTGLFFNQTFVTHSCINCSWIKQSISPSYLKGIVWAIHTFYFFFCLSRTVSQLTHRNRNSIGKIIFTREENVKQFVRKFPSQKSSQQKPWKTPWTPFWYLFVISIIISINSCFCYYRNKIKNKKY